MSHSLLSLGATIIPDYTHFDVYEPDNLTKNLGLRTAFHWLYPVIDNSGTTDPSINSCYAVLRSDINGGGVGPFVMTVDLLKERFVN